MPWSWWTMCYTPSRSLSEQIAEQNIWIQRILCLPVTERTIWCSETMVLLHTSGKEHPWKLELCRVHTCTPRARCICICIYKAAAASVRLYSRRLLPTYCARLCAWAESTWPVVGRVDRRGQQKHSICKVCRPCQPIRSIMKPVFQRFQLIYCAYESLRCLDLQIWRFLCWQTDRQTKLITLPLAHACGVMKLAIICDRAGIHG